MAKRSSLLIVGCGDVGLRVVRALGGRLRVFALTSSPARRDALRAAGVTPLLGDLDDPAALSRLAGLADAVLYLAPPPTSGHTDPRLRALLGALSLRSRPARVVYASTTGVYGDCRGERVTETRPLNPTTDRARRRVDAESRLRAWGRATGARVTTLRIPGIYAMDREGGDPRERVRRGTPVLAAADDGYTNHIHADDLARACIAALWRGKPQRVVQVCDDSDMKTGDYYDLVADLSGLARPARVTRAQAGEHFSAAQWSFLNESRRLSNERMKRELRLRLSRPTIREGLAD
ncbi:SDR family oxidoreductase [Scleromatobacter humisilvae]|uniref:SDR family oxidoreductase n=1 Tax=Scleromatobacter humisilvae TaxID=2897159 RepID=A0A9X2C1H1_9BURK|nr:SDR family oxidoreductase [Scleromatobacter humisilvae]MCK9688292.1 SDR family oxidoreductase [Scleromatobacter humisilvae]